MGIQEVERIKDIFSELGLNPVYLEHEPVITSQDAARVRGISLKQGIKALLFTNDSNDWVIACVPADRKVNQKKVASSLSWQKKSIRMATPEEVLEKTGCEVGSVPPIGHKEKIKIIVDKDVYDNEESDFNIGLRTHSARIPTIEMKKAFYHVNASEGDFARHQ